MISFDSSLNLIQKSVLKSLKSEFIDINESFGRILASDLYSKCDYPRENLSSMDGAVIFKSDLNLKEIEKALMLNASQLLPMTSHFPALHRVLANPKTMKKNLSKVGITSEQEVTFEEFYQLILRLRKEEDERLALLHIFQLLDRNDDGRLTLDEIIYMLVIKREKILPFLKPYPILTKIIEPEKSFG